MAAKFKLTQDLQGKVALITGANTGIGRVTARELAKRGAHIVITARNQERAQPVLDEIRTESPQAKVDFIPLELSNFASIRACANAFIALNLPLHILVNNAASGYARPVMEQKVKGWDWTMNINARAALFLSQKAAPLMQKRGGGAIVNVMSIGNILTLPEYVVIGASKGALEVVTRYCAVELASMGIVVNAVSPGVIETDALNFFTATSKLSRDDARKWIYSLSRCSHDAPWNEPRIGRNGFCHVNVYSHCSIRYAAIPSHGPESAVASHHHHR